MRQPEDPAPPPAEPASTPNEPTPAEPEGGTTPPTPPVEPGARPPAASPPAPAGAPGEPGTRVATRPPLTFDSWEFWWGHNKDSFLDLRAKVRRVSMGTGTGATLLRVGRIHRRGGSTTSLPTDVAIRTRILPALEDALAPDRHDEIRAAAAISLGKIGATRPERTEAIATHLLHLMTNAKDRESGYVEESAALGLGLLQSHDPVVVFALGDKLLGRRGSNRHVRTRAFSAIALGLLRVPSDDPVHDRVVHAFRGVLRQRASRADVPASTLLGMGLSGDPEFVPDLVERITAAGARGDDLIRSYAVSALGRIAEVGRGIDGPMLVKVLRDVLVDGGPHCARSAAIALGPIGGRGDLGAAPLAVAVRALRRAANRGEGHAGSLALISLGRMAGRTADAETRGRIRRDLEVRLTDGTTRARPYAALALGLLGRGAEDGRDVADLLRQRFEEYRGDPADRGALAIALGLIGDRRAGPPLLRVLSDRGEMRRLRGYCAIALGMLGDIRARDPIRTGLESERDEALRADLAVAAGLLGDRETVRVLLDLLGDPKTGLYVQGCVALSLGRIGDKRCIEPLVRMLEDDRTMTAIRVRAAMALGLLGDRLDASVIARISRDVNYRAQVEAVSEVLRIL